MKSHDDDFPAWISRHASLGHAPDAEQQHARCGAEGAEEMSSARRDDFVGHDTRRHAALIARFDARIPLPNIPAFDRCYDTMSPAAISPPDEASVARPRARRASADADRLPRFEAADAADR